MNCSSRPLSSLLCSLLLFLFLFSSQVSSIETPPSSPEKSALVVTIEENIALAESKGFTLPWMNLALSRAPFYLELQNKYDTFFTNNVGTTNPSCQAQQSELLSTFHFTISKIDLPNFLKEDFVKSLPDNVQNQLKLLKWSQKDLTVADTFSRMLTIPNQGEAFEVGHVMFKSSYDGTNYRILLLVPSVKSVLNSGCQFENQFHNEFIGKSQDIQNLLAIKAAENRAIVNTLEAYSQGDDLARLGFELVHTKAGTLLRNIIEM
jgi:hypothetical protein